MMRLVLVLVLVLVQTVTPDNIDGQNEVPDGCEGWEEECAEVEEEECGACHSIYMRECNIKMQYTYTPVKVRECSASLCGKLGYKRKCYTKYYSRCGTKMVYREMTEDHPVCGVKKQTRCTDKGCKEVPVMRCEIEKRTVRKAKPETSCTRVPSQVCRKEKCAPERCFERVKMTREMTPKEDCQYKEKRVCQQTDKPDCRTVTRRHCTPVHVNKGCKSKQTSGKQTKYVNKSYSQAP